VQRAHDRRNWGKNTRPSQGARFSATYTLLMAAAALFILAGVDPLRLTELSMALTAASLPVGVLPFLILTNDEKYLGEHTNAPIANAVVMAISLMAMALAVVSIPLEVFGS
jgi:Mn2+/Fe2+ NRAMP family transporter